MFTIGGFEIEVLMFTIRGAKIIVFGVHNKVLKSSFLCSQKEVLKSSFLVFTKRGVKVIVFSVHKKRC